MICYNDFMGCSSDLSRVQYTLSINQRLSQNVVDRLPLNQVFKVDLLIFITDNQLLLFQVNACAENSTKCLILMKSEVNTTLYFTTLFIRLYRSIIEWARRGGDSLPSHLTNYIILYRVEVTLLIE